MLDRDNGYEGNPFLLFTRILAVARCKRNAYLNSDTRPRLSHLMKDYETCKKLELNPEGTCQRTLEALETFLEWTFYNPFDIIRNTARDCKDDYLPGPFFGRSPDSQLGDLGTTKVN
jgi:hypothetical protein